MLEDFKFVHELVFQAVLSCCSDELRDARSLFGIDEAVAVNVATLSPAHRRAFLVPSPPGVIELRIPVGQVSAILSGDRSVSDVVGPVGPVSVEKMMGMRSLNFKALSIVRDVVARAPGLGCSAFRITKQDGKFLAETSLRRVEEVFGDFPGCAFTLWGHDQPEAWKRISSTSVDIATVIPVMGKRAKVLS